MVAVTTEALVLHAFDYLETSRILRLSTRELGLVSVIARGARRSVKRFGSALDLFAEGRADLRVREGRDLQELVAFDVRRARPGLAADLDRFNSASMLAELVLRCSAGEDHGGGLFEAVSTALDDLLRVSRVAARVHGLQAAWRLTAVLGFAPATEHCASCHADLPAAGDAAFSSEAGGALCDACASGRRGTRRLPAEARLQLGRWRSGRDATMPDEGIQRAHVRLLREFLVQHVTEGAELRAFDAWRNRFAAAPTPLEGPIR
jgi:DNA repair protein RecO (recombination protein O)